MAVYKGRASLRPRCTRGGSSIAAIPVYHSTVRGSLLRVVDGMWKFAHIRHSLISTSDMYNNGLGTLLSKPVGGFLVNKCCVDNVCKTSLYLPIG
jgi:hypothetical protein